jgi:hypothetical protein
LHAEADIRRLSAAIDSVRAGVDTARGGGRSGSKRTTSKREALLADLQESREYAAASKAEINQELAQMKTEIARLSFPVDSLREASRDSGKHAAG